MILDLDDDERPSSASLSAPSTTTATRCRRGSTRSRRSSPRSSRQSGASRAHCPRFTNPREPAPARDAGGEALPRSADDAGRGRCGSGPADRVVQGLRPPDRAGSRHTGRPLRRRYRRPRPAQAARLLRLPLARYRLRPHRCQAVKDRQPRCESPSRGDGQGPEAPKPLHRPRRRDAGMDRRSPRPLACR